MEATSVLRTASRVLGSAGVQENTFKLVHIGF